MYLIGFLRDKISVSRYLFAEVLLIIGYCMLVFEFKYKITFVLFKDPGDQQVVHWEIKSRTH